MATDKRIYIWGGAAVLLVLIVISWNTYSQQSRIKNELQAQARKLQGLQGSDTVTAKDLLATMTKNMQDQKPTINFSL